MKILFIIVLLVAFFSTNKLSAQVNFKCGVGFTPKQYDLPGYNELIDTIKSNFRFTQQFFTMKWAVLQGINLDTAYNQGVQNQINNYLIDLIHQNNIDLLISLDITFSNNRQKLNIPDTCSGVPCDSLFQQMSVKQAYINEVAYIARKYKPAYFALAVEIDEYIRVSQPAERNALLQAISIAIDSVKNIDPTIKTFVYFQFENTKCKNLWNTIKPFADISDIYGFSSYPSAIGAYCSGTQPIFGSNLPNDYYDTVATIWGNQKPIAFAEIGEPSDSNYILPVASEQNQKNFIEKLKISVSDLKIDFINWIYLYDVNLPDSLGGNYFNSMGLLRYLSGIAKLGYPSFRCDSIIPYFINDNYTITSKNFTFYPNPCNNIINLHIPITDCQIKILDLLGNIVYEKNLTSEYETIKLYLQNGFYFICFMQDNKIIATNKLIINN